MDGSEATGKWMRLGRRVAGAFPWGPLAVLLAVVTLGASQIVFTMIRTNPGWFPAGGWFTLWTLFWFLALPVGISLGIDRLVARRGEDRWPFRIWRAALYAFVVLSFLRQVEVYYLDLYLRFLGDYPSFLVYGLLGGTTVLLSVRFRKAAHQYMAFLSILAVYLAGSFAWSSSSPSPGPESPVRAGPPPPARITPGARPAVCILLTDEFSRDLLERDGKPDREAFPNLWALMDEGVWFSRATTNFGMTHEALPSILTGWRKPDGKPCLFERVAAEYEIRVIETAWPTELWMDGRELDRSVAFLTGKRRMLARDPFLAGAYTFQNLLHTPFLRRTDQRILHNSPTLHATFERERAAFFEKAGKPGTLSFWHTSLPHAPFIFAADGTRHGMPDVAFDQDTPFEGPGRRETLQNYREQARFVDTIVGQLVRRLKADGTYERTIIAVTSDHGLRAWGANLSQYFDRTVAVPLVIRAPGLKPGRLDVEYQHLDFAPTVLEVMGIRFDPAEFEGVSAFAPDRKIRRVVFEFLGVKYVRDERGIWIVKPKE